MRQITHLKSACLVAAFSSALAGPATAEIVQDRTTGTITCTTPPGHYSRRIVTGVGEGGRISGMIRMIRPDPSPRYTAAAGFIFKETGTRNTGVHIGLRPGTTDRIVVGLHIPGEGPLIEVGEFSARLWFPLAVSYASGTLTVEVAGRSFRRRVRMTAPLLPVLHCNSGTFEFRLGPGLGMGERPADPEGDD
jgi:hypothetical protein